MLKERKAKRAFEKKKPQLIHLAKTELARGNKEKAVELFAKLKISIR